MDDAVIGAAIWEVGKAELTRRSRLSKPRRSRKGRPLSDETRERLSLLHLQRHIRQREAAGVIESDEDRQRRERKTETMRQWRQKKREERLGGA